MSEQMTYIEQGSGRVYFPDDDCRVNIEVGTCSCDEPDCQHLQVARAATSSHPGGAGWDLEELSDLAGELFSTKTTVKRIHGADGDLYEITVHGFRHVLNSEFYRRLQTYVMRCRRCGQWRHYYDMSEDVEDVCLECVR